MQSYLDRSLALSRLSIRDREYVPTWNALEDDVLALSPAQQNELYDLCASWPHNGALIIFSMFPDEVTYSDKVA